VLLLVGVVLVPLVLFKFVLLAVLLPFKILGGLFKAVVGLVSGLAGLAFGLAVAVISIVAIPLLLLAIPLLPFIVIGGIVWVIAKGLHPTAVRV
jgi:hypothetical protein